MPTIAVVFDFDDTLMPDSTSALLEHFGIDALEFWSKRARGLVDEGYDPPLAYLNLLLREAGPGKPLGSLTIRELEAFGASLDDRWFPGLPDLFDSLREQVRTYRDTSVEFYIISGGLQRVIQGSEIVRKHFSGVYGCQLAEDPEVGHITSIKRCVTFTEKTRFIFEINKGIEPAKAATKPHLVNEEVAADKRRIPLNQTE